MMMKRGETSTVDREWPSEHHTVMSVVEKQCHVTEKTSLRTGKGVLYKI